MNTSKNVKVRQTDNTIRIECKSFEAIPLGDWQEIERALNEAQGHPRLNILISVGPWEADGAYIDFTVTWSEVHNQRMFSVFYSACGLYCSAVELGEGSPLRVNGESMIAVFGTPDERIAQMSIGGD